MDRKSQKQLFLSRSTGPKASALVARLLMNLAGYSLSAAVKRGPLDSVTDLPVHRVLAISLSFIQRTLVVRGGNCARPTSTPGMKTDLPRFRSSMPHVDGSHGGTQPMSRR